MNNQVPTNQTEKPAPENPTPLASPDATPLTPTDAKANTNPHPKRPLIIKIGEAIILLILLFAATKFVTFLNARRVTTQVYPSPTLLPPYPSPTPLP